MDAIRRFFAQLGQYWGSLGFARRTLIVLAVIGVAVALSVVGYLSQTSSFVPVYKELAPEEAGAMKTLLTGQGIPNELSADGTSILVPQERLAEARVALATGGLPTRGGKGYELFDESSLMTTPFVQNVNYQRALQAELARSISQIDSVQTARVMIARPESSPFVRDQQPTTASVVLKLKNGATMSRGTASSVVSLVARSVEGLKPENVTVIDSGGRLLSDPHAADRESLPGTHLEYREKLETYLASKAEKMLAHHLGPGRAVVQVSADINFQKVKERQEVFPAEGRVAIAERQHTSTNTGSSARGVVGAVSNVARAGGAFPPSGGGSGSNSKDEEISTDYIVPRTVRELEDSTGAVTRLSIAALVDLTPAAEGDKVITEADVLEIIKQSIGYRTGRDEVKVSNVRLTGPVGPVEPDDTLAKIDRVQAYVGLARNISMALAVVLVLAILALIMLRRMPKPVPPPDAAAVAAAAADADAARRAADLTRLADLARLDPVKVAAVIGMMATPTP